MITGFPYNFKNPIAGKTGTSQHQSDGWFIGAVPNLVTGVWTGGEDRATHFKGIRKGQGASMSLPSWALYMKSCYADDSLNISKEDFKRPKRVAVSINCPEIINIEEESKTIDIDNLDIEDVQF